MKSPPTEVVVGSDGELSVEAGGRDAGVGAMAGRYRLLPGPPGLLVLQRVDGSANARARVLMSGELVGEGRAIELVATIAANGWRGQLTLLDGDARRRLDFDQGALRAAYSELPAERLGEVMVARGVISQDELARCVSDMGAERRLGEVAIDHGLIEPQQLFDLLRAQAERIFQAALLMAEGTYLFVLPPDDTEAPAMALHLPIQELLLESVQRIDEMQVFRERIPSGAVRPLRSEAALVRATLSESLRPIAMLADGAHSITDIGRELGLDEFTVTKRVMHLLQIGCVEIRDKPGIDPESVRRIVRQLNDVLCEINDTVERHGGGPQMRWTLKQWIEDSGMQRYFGDRIPLDGRISADTALSCLEKLGAERPVEALHRAAHELVSFAMFSASPTLPRDSERALSKWVHQRVFRMRL